MSHIDDPHIMMREAIVEAIGNMRGGCRPRIAAISGFPHDGHSRPNAGQ